MTPALVSFLLSQPAGSRSRVAALVPCVAFTEVPMPRSSVRYSGAPNVVAAPNAPLAEPPGARPATRPGAGRQPCRGGSARRFRYQPSSALLMSRGIIRCPAGRILLADGILRPVNRGEPVSFRPPAWRERSRKGAIEVPAGCEMVIVEGVGAARRELMAMVDVVVWVKSDMAEAERRGIERDGGDEAAVSSWHRWMAEELPFIVQERPWERAAFIVAGTPLLPHDPDSQVVIAGAVCGPGLPPSSS